MLSIPITNFSNEQPLADGHWVTVVDGEDEDFGKAEEGEEDEEQEYSAANVSASEVNAIPDNRNQRRSAFELDLAKVIGAQEAAHFLASLSEAPPTCEAVAEGFESAVSSKTIQEVARRLSLSVPPTYEITYSLAGLAEGFYCSNLQQTKFTLIDQQVNAISRRSVTSNWATIDGDGTYLMLKAGSGSAKDAQAAARTAKKLQGPTLGRFPCPTTDFLEAAGFTPDITPDIDFYDLQYLAFERSMSGKKPLRALPKVAHKIQIFLEVVRRYATLVVLEGSVEASLSAETEEDITEALQLLASVNARFKYWKGSLVSDASVLRYSLYTMNGSVGVILHGLAPCGMAHAYTGQAQRRRQDVCLAFFRAILPKDSIQSSPTEASLNAASRFPIRFKKKRGVKIAAIPEWKNALHAIERSFPDITDQELSLRDPSLALRLQAFLAEEASISDLVLFQIPPSSSLKMVGRLLQMRADRSNADKLAVRHMKALRNSDAATEDSEDGSLPEEVERLLKKGMGAIPASNADKLQLAAKIAEASSRENGHMLRVLYQKHEAEFDGIKMYSQLTKDAKAALLVYQGASIHRIDPKLQGQALLAAVRQDGATRVYKAQNSTARAALNNAATFSKYNERERARTDLICHAPTLLTTVQGAKKIVAASMHPDSICGESENKRWYLKDKIGGPVCNNCRNKYYRLSEKGLLTMEDLTKEPEKRYLNEAAANMKDAEDAAQPMASTSRLPRPSTPPQPVQPLQPMQVLVPASPLRPITPVRQGGSAKADQVADWLLFTLSPVYTINEYKPDRQSSQSEQEPARESPEVLTSLQRAGPENLDLVRKRASSPQLDSPSRSAVNPNPQDSWSILTRPFKIPKFANFGKPFSK